MTSTAPRVAFAEHAAQRNVPATRAACLLVACLMPAGILLDVVTEPGHALEFFEIRLVATGAALVVLAITYTPSVSRHIGWLGPTPAFIGAGAISVMVEKLGGYASPYYAGLSLCILGIGLVFYWTALQAAIVCAFIILIWLVPALLKDAPLEIGPFFNNLYFLVLTAVIAVASNAIRYRLARREFEAQGQLADAGRELRDALEQLRRLDQTKNHFFANISHELRTPLTLILAPIEELLERPTEPALRNLLNVVRSNAGRLLRLIDELLDLSRLDAGGLRLNIGAVDIRALVDTIHRNSEPLAKSKLIELRLDIPHSVEGLFGDSHRIESILTNLVSNALKYTQDNGHVWIRLRDEAQNAEIEVEDDGPGIAPKDIPHVFDRFFQGQERDRRRGGVGLGLALAKELAELHGGSLTVSSELGKGTLFRLRLRKGRDHFAPTVIERRADFQPTASVGRRFDDEDTIAGDLMTPVPGTPRHWSPRSGQRVLVVEDRDELRAFLASLLNEEYRVLEAPDAERGLDIIRREQPDLVLSDVMMPGRSGTNLCSTLKRDPKLRSIPVILLTARVGSEATLEAYAHGADDFVAKPFHPRVLLARVRAQLRLRDLALQLASTEKLAAIGTLAAGVAHEVRNPLNALLNAATLLEEAELSPDKAKKMLGIIIDTAERIRTIVGALDAHAQPAEGGAHHPFDLRPGLEATLRLLEYRSQGATIEVRFDTDRMAMGASGSINQVLLNLLDNALRAGAKTIQVVVRNEPDWIVVTVANDGADIPAEIAERIFDPFFTTRAPGEGTGLGLYLSRQIVEESGGTLHLVRRSGGTEFEMRLPDADSVPSHRLPPFVEDETRPWR